MAAAIGAPSPFIDGDLVVFNTSWGQNSSGQGGVVAGRRYYVSDVYPGLCILRLRDYASTVATAVDLNRSLLAGAAVSSGAELSLDATANQLFDVRATTVAGEAVAIGTGSTAWSQVTAIDASAISAIESTTLAVNSTDGASLTEASARVIGINTSPVCSVSTT